MLITAKKTNKSKIKDFWSLGDSLYSGIKLSESELREVREKFGKKWARNRVRVLFCA